MRKLQWLAKEHGGPEQIAAAANISAEALDQVLKGVLLPPKRDGSRTPRSLGDKAVEAIEDAFKLGRGWFDTDDGFDDFEDVSRRATSTGPALPPSDFRDRHLVTESEWTALQEIKDIESSPRLASRLKELRAELAEMRAFAEEQYRRRVEEAKAHGGHAGGMSVFGELPAEAAPAPQRKEGQR